MSNPAALGLAGVGGKSRMNRSEYDDGLLRDNVRINNKHHRELRVHERAKNVVSRNIDKEAQLFKQKQASQKNKLPGLNAQGQKHRLSIGGSDRIPDLKSAASPNGTLSPPIEESHLDRKSPLSPRYDPYTQLPLSNDLPKISGKATLSGLISPELNLKPEAASPRPTEKLKKQSPVEGTTIIIPQRGISRMHSGVNISPRSNVKVPTRGLYMDATGRVREETVFDFLSKPKYCSDLQRRRDTRIRLEKEFTPRKTTTKSTKFGLSTTGNLKKNPW